MKKWINKTDQQLLERFPLLWVTRAHWVLLVSIIIHLVFFAMGWNVFKNPLLLQDYNADDIYIRNGILLLSIICSVLMVVVWLIVLFRHNAFKNFYPTSRWQLFSSFIIYFIVLLLSSTFYSSYQMGYKGYIIGKYTDAVYNKKMDQANLAAAFLSLEQESYTVDQKMYPAPFDTIYCEKEEASIDLSKPHLKRFNEEFQFYTIKKVKQYQGVDLTGDGTTAGHIYSEPVNDSVTMYWYKDQVVDVSAFTTTDPSYFNFSKTLFNDHELHYGSYNSYEPGNNERREKGIAINKKVYELLKRNKDTEIRQLLANFLATAKEFHIKTNLTPDDWLKLINRETFVVDKFIINTGYPQNSYSHIPEPVEAMTAATAAVDEVAATAETAAVQSEKQRYYNKGRTQYYFDAGSLQNVFSNISAIKGYDYEYWRILLPVQCWLAFGLAMILFIFRTSGLSALLFSIIAAIVIAIAVSLVVVGLNIHSELIISYLAFIIGTVILATPLFLLKKIRKKIAAVFINITIVGFVPYILLIIGIISMHQKDYYKAKLGSLYYKQTAPPLLIEQLGMDLNTYLLIAGFLFMLLYTTIVKKWKALPEG